MLQADLRQPCPGVSGSSHLRDRSCSNGHRIIRREDHPVLPCFKRSFFPIKSDEGQTQSDNSKVFADTYSGKPAEEIRFKLSAASGMPDGWTLEFQTQSSLADA